jgi:hypothetical protein
LSYLQNYEPDELIHIAGNVYCTRTHDSLKISNGLWQWHSRGIGGRSALDYLIKVRNMGFLDAVERIMGRTAVQSPVFMPAEKERPKTPFTLPEPDTSTQEVERYLTGRAISRDVIRYCLKSHTLYQSRNKGYANIVFVGYDADKAPRYATIRGTRGNFKGEVKGSDKRFGFRILAQAETDSVLVTEGAIDALSLATLTLHQGRDYRALNLLSLGGITPAKATGAVPAVPRALVQYLKDNPHTRQVHLHLDNDAAGIAAAEAIGSTLGKQGLEVSVHLPPEGRKDVNEYLMAFSRDRKAQHQSNEKVR